MSNLSAARFNEFFDALYGYEPFPWQTKLAKRVVEDTHPWPKALALPTAAGKTACIDIAVFALACQADRPAEEQTAPRRIFFVVDRRIIVDETHERAKNLAIKLQKAQKDEAGILKEVADQLAQLAFGERPTPEENDGDDPNNHPLAVFQLRGGMYRDDAWARSPLQPTVVVTTVDQYGSRLLFRGYGSSPGMRPIHAGLAANDSLIVLDEAHCANPFRQTVDSVERYRNWAEKKDSTGSVPFHLTLLSATPPTDIEDEDIFRYTDEDIQHEVFGSRIKASKPAKLVELRSRRRADPASGKDNVLDRLAERIAAEAKDLVSEERCAVGVIVNRVYTARLVQKRLTDEECDSVLLTGRMRSMDRDDIAERLKPLKTGRPRDGRTRFVVATQTLEVGADLDFDGLVTECASLDALRQRFGRLNRNGRDIEARATIVIQADQTKPSSRAGNDPVYGEALPETWQWLKQRADKDVIDFGYVGMEAILPPDREEVDKLRQQAPDAPVMLPAHVDAWVQTSPVPAPDPDVSLFLHGPERGGPEVQVCWRADLSRSDMSADGERASDIVSLCPPTSSECIPVPLHRLRRWLEGADQDAGQDDSDVEGTRIPDDNLPRERRETRRRVLRWRGPTESCVISTRAALQQLQPGDTVVIPAEMGGWDTFGHIPDNSEGNQVIDLGDRAHLQSKSKAVLRVHPKIVESWPDYPARKRFKDLAERSEDAEDELDGDEIKRALEDLAKDLEDVDTTSQWKWLKDAASTLFLDRRLKRLAHPGGGFVLQGSRRIKGHTDSTLTSEDDSYSATVRVSLDAHLKGVELWAERLCNGVGLPEPLAKDLALAAKLHDVGKADPRFQAMLHGGNWWAAQASGPLLAKSGNLPTSRMEFRRALRQSGYPHNARHELLSVRMIQNTPALLEPDSDEDLVLHLVASHHGYCRPFAPVVPDKNQLKVEAEILERRMSACSNTGLERLDSGVPERFWRLVRRYGWWGMAWLESLMRLADHRCSGEEERKYMGAE